MILEKERVPVAKIRAPAAQEKDPVAKIRAPVVLDLNSIKKMDKMSSGRHRDVKRTCLECVG